MLKTNELRRGNFFSCSDCTYQVEEISNCYIKGRNINGFSEGEFSESISNPIKITDEWIDKFNLVNGVFSGNEFFSIRKSYVSEHYCLLFENEYTATDIQYVHELQNLYFLICGCEELVFSTEP